MAEGTVLWYSPNLDYGFIRRDDAERDHLLDAGRALLPF